MSTLCSQIKKKLIFHQIPIDTKNKDAPAINLITRNHFILCQATSLRKEAEGWEDENSDDGNFCADSHPLSDSDDEGGWDKGEENKRLMTSRRSTYRKHGDPMPLSLTLMHYLPNKTAWCN